MKTYKFYVSGTLFAEVTAGIVSMVDASRQRLFVEVSQDVHELVYVDEIVR